MRMIEGEGGGSWARRWLRRLVPTNLRMAAGLVGLAYIGALAAYGLAEMTARR